MTAPFAPGDEPTTMPKGRTALIRALWAGDADQLKQAIQPNTDLNSPIPALVSLDQGNDLPPLFYVLRCNALRLDRHLEQHGTQRQALLTVLLAQGADASIAWGGELRPLAEAVLQGDPYSVAALLAHGADGTPPRSYPHHHNRLVRPSLFHLLGVMSDAPMGTAERFEATQQRLTSVVQQLADAGYDPRTPNRYGEPAWQLALADARGFVLRALWSVQPLDQPEEVVVAMNTLANWLSDLPASTLGLAALGMQATFEYAAPILSAWAERTPELQIVWAQTLHTLNERMGAQCAFARAHWSESETLPWLRLSSVVQRARLDQATPVSSSGPPRPRL